MVEIDWTGEDVLALRVAMRRSRSEFARLVGVTQRTVILWENGRTTRMHAASQRLLDRVLSEADSVVVARFERAITAGREMAPTNPAGAAGRRIPALDKEVEDDDMQRRELLACIGAGLAGQAAAMVAGEPEKMLATLDAGSISERRLALLEESADTLGRTVVQVPPHELLQGTLEQFRTVRSILADRQATHQQIRLVRTAGRLANIVGEILFNDGHFGRARMWYTTAIHAAQDIGDRFSEDIALAGLAYLPTYSDKPREVLRLLAPRLGENPNHGAAAAWLWGMAARAHASVGESAQFEYCIARSANALDGIPNAELPVGIFSFRPEKLAFYRAIGYSRLGRAEETAQAAAQALSLYDPRETTEPALVRFEHATALLESGEVEHACAVATEAITDGNTYVGLTVGKRARLFDAALTHRRGPAIADWRERARPVLAAATDRSV
ncbi:MULTISPECIES: DNA-binding transcriptional regulator [unclassified Nocardia]|uniref:helix-turn-helix domain-containing protein n=1 Tax=unclassified Nocardia TaxID=2637762 RepID=UPI001CE404FC|nr:MULTISPECIES: helix-turn-helix transcriptional regulator [unclassified Nocardia]